jgi:hypothetical protein
MSSLWLSIEPKPTETRLMLSQSTVGTLLRARLPATPAQPQALAQLLEGMVAWFGQPLCAVLDADAQDVQDHPDRWSDYFGPLNSPHITIAWSALSLVPERRDPWLGKLGNFSRAKRLINLAATGQP